MVKKITAKVTGVVTDIERSADNVLEGGSILVSLLMDGMKHLGTELGEGVEEGIREGTFTTAKDTTTFEEVVEKYRNKAVKPDEVS